MKYLLTGATGYLGSRLLEALIADGHQLVVLKRSVSNLARITKCQDVVECYDVDKDGLDVSFERHAPFDAVIHAATCYGRSGEACSELVEANLYFPLQVLERTGRGGADLFINADTSLPRDLNMYALSKKQFAEWGRKFADEGKLRWVNMLLEHFYGPGDDSNKLVTWLVRSCLANEPELPLTKGEQRRDFVHIDDVVRAFQGVLAVQCPQPLTEYAVGSGQSMEIRKIAEMIRGLCNSSTHLKFGEIPYRHDEVMDSYADLGALKQLGWSPIVSFEDGLKSLIAVERRLLSV